MPNDNGIVRLSSAYNTSSDIASGKPMNRLLQGDVGSGKTIVAVLSMLMVIDAGYQVALMCPTELLAEQHYLTIKNLMESDTNLLTK